MVLERIKEFIDYKGLSIAAFERSIGMSNASFGKSLKNKGAIGSDKIENILFKYKELSAEWLLTGNGEMIKPSVSRVVMETTAIHQPRTFEKKEEMQVVYLYDFNASAGLRSLFDNTKQNIIDSIKIPNLPKCDGAIHIVGDSMYPLLKSGDIILYKQMPLDIENLLYGEMYLLSYDIDGEDYIVVKYVRKSGKGENSFFVICGCAELRDRKSVV